MSLETNHETENENDGLADYLDNIQEQNSFDLKKIDIPILKDKKIKYIYQLKNDFFIIAQEKQIYIVNLKNISLCYNFHINHLITCICQINEKQVIFCQNNGLYILAFSNYEVHIDKISDIKYNLILKVTNNDKNNDYIISLPHKGTFRVTEYLSSINENDLNHNNKISNKEYNIGEIIEINNYKFAVLINNKEDEDTGILEIIDINNIQRYYILNKSNYLYIPSNNCILSFKTKKDKNNHIFLCATKKQNKNGILAINIGLPLNKSTFECFKDIKNLKITCMSLFKKENTEEEQFFTYFLIGGINYRSEVEIRLFKIIDLNDQGNNCLSIDFIKTVFYDNEIMTSINWMYQSIKGKEFLIASNNCIYQLNKQNEEEEI